MRKMTPVDQYGDEIKIGMTITYPSGSSSNLHMRTSEVIDIEYDPTFLYVKEVDGVLVRVHGFKIRHMEREEVLVPKLKVKGSHSNWDRTKITHYKSTISKLERTTIVNKKIPEEVIPGDNA